MKKLALSIFALVLFTASVCAQSATITIFSQDGEKFWVILDGIRQNATPNTNVKVTGLTSPNYRLKIIFEDEKIKSIDKSVMTRDVDNVLCDQAYVVRKDKKGKMVMRLNSFEPAKDASVAAEPNQVAVPFTTQEKRPEPTPPVQETKPQEPARGEQKPTVGVSVKDPVTGETISMDMNISETGVGVNVKAPGNEQISMDMNVDMKENATSHTQVTTTTSTTTTGRDNKPQEQREPQQTGRTEYKHPGYNGPQNCNYPMSDNDFADAKKSISSKSFEDSKLTIAKQITASNCLLASQVKDIMSLFSFEDSKLQFAKYAYTYTLDIGNYYKVNDAFTFEMSIDELNEYISSQKR